MAETSTISLSQHTQSADTTSASEAGIRRTLQQVNQLFNRIPYRSDAQHWHQDDYWATPSETLRSNGADCEDYSIGKYFTLRALGIPDSALRLVYMTLAGQREPHMVLTYQDDSLEQPLVLDNLTSRILPLNKRRDLKAVYSFNGENLWLAAGGRASEDRRLGSPASLEQWASLLDRMPVDESSGD